MKEDIGNMMENNAGVIDEVYKERRTLQKRKFVHEHRQNRIKKKNAVLDALELVLLVLLLILSGYMTTCGNPVAWVLAAVAVLLAVSVLLRKLLRLEKAEEREALEAARYCQALSILDKQIMKYKISGASREDQVNGMEMFEMLDCSDHIFTEEWNKIGELYEQERKRHRENV